MGHSWTNVEIIGEAEKEGSKDTLPTTEILSGKNARASHSQMEHYFFSYLQTWEVDLIEILEIMVQMRQYVIFLCLKPTKVTSDFILY